MTDHPTAPPERPVLSRPGVERTSLVVVNALADALRLLPGTDGVGRQFAKMSADHGPDRHVTVSRAAVLDALVDAKVASGRPDIGLAIGELLTEASFDTLGMLIATSVDGRQAIEAFLQLQRSLFGGPAWELQIDLDDGSLGYAFDPFCDHEGARIEAEVQVTIAYQASVRFCGARRGSQVSAAFIHAAPPHRTACERVFGSRVRFAQAQNGLRFPRSLIELARPGVSAEIAGACRRLADQRLHRPEESWSERCLHSLQEQRSLRDLNLDEFAQGFGVSLRTLRRQLRREGTSPSELREHARFDRARRMLANTTLSIQQIAEELGYFQTTTLYRAFRRWAGTSPKSFRRELRASALREPDRAVHDDAASKSVR